MIRFQPVFAALIALGIAAPALAQLELDDPYIRGLPPGVDNTAAYMTIINHGDAPVELTHGSSPIAGSVMLHSTTEHGGMLHMEHVGSVVIRANSKVQLKSGDLHLMLMELKEHPQPGDEVELTLHFADGSAETFSVPVRSVLDE